MFKTLKYGFSQKENIIFFIRDGLIMSFLSIKNLKNKTTEISILKLNYEMIVCKISIQINI